MNLKKHLPLLAASLIVTAPAFAGNLEIKNPGFEQSADEAEGWRVSQHAGEKAYAVAIDDKVFAEGKRSFRMRRTEEQVFGLVRQDIKVPGIAGKTLRFSAMLKTEKVGREGWGLVVNFLSHSGGTILGGSILGQVRSKPLTGDSDWTPVEIVAPIPEKTEKLSLGIMLLDEGTGWVDEIQVSIE